MSKIETLPTFTAAPNSSQMNDAFAKITTAMSNTLSRDGTTPNTMSADLDINGNDILNVDNLNVNGSLVLNGVTVTTTNLTIPSTPTVILDFSSRAEFVIWSQAGTKTVGDVANAEGLSYEYDGTSTIWLDLPGWKLAIPRVPATAAIYAPTVTFTNIGSVLADQKYNSMAGLFRDRQGTLRAVWNGNDATNSVENDAGQTIYMADSADNGATFGAKYTPFTSATYASNRFAGSDVLLIQAVPVDFNGTSWVAWNAARQATNQGAFLSFRTSGLWTNRKLMQRTSDGAIVARSELLTADAPAGYTTLWDVGGEDWFAYPQWMKNFDGVFYMGVTLCHPTDGFTVAVKKNVTLSSADGATFTIGTPMPEGVIQPYQPWEWDVIRLPNGHFRAYIRINYEYAGDGSVSSTQSIAYKQAVAESPDLMAWSAPTFAPLATHKQRITTTQMPNGFWGMALNDHRLSRNNQGLHLIRDGGALASAVDVSNETSATEWAHTGSAFYDSVTGKTMVIWSASYNSGGYTNPSAIRVAIVTGTPATATLNVIPQSRDDAPTTSGTTLTFSGTAAAGIDVPLHDYTLMFEYAITGTALTGSQTVVICSAGSAQAGLQVQKRRERVEIVPVANGRAGNALRVLDDTVLSITVQPDFIQINGNRFWLPGSGEFHFGDYHGTGSDLTDPVLSIDVAKIRCGEAAYSNPTSNWYGSPGRNVIRNGDCQWDQKNDGANYSDAVGCKLDGWNVFDDGGATFTVNRQQYSTSAAAAYFGSIQPHMRVNASVLGATDAIIGQVFEGAGSFAGDLMTLALDLYDDDNGILPVTVEWMQYFGTGGSPTATQRNRLSTLYLNGNEKRHTVSFIVPPIIPSYTFGSNLDDYAALTFRIPFHQTLADLRFGRVRMCEGLSARGVGSDNDDQVLRDFVVMQATDANTVFANGYMTSATEMRGAVNYGVGKRAPTLETEGTFQVTNGTGSVTGAITLARAGLATGELRMTGVSGFTTGHGAVIRAASDATARLMFNRRLVK